MNPLKTDKKLFIIGSGPGDPELLTLKAYKTIKSAEVILYDNLCSEKILEIAPKTCNMIYVGKKPYKCCTPQEKINDLIVEHASQGKIVVRLKGGDPFIFGRGFEELLFAEAHGITATYIPGISSMQGIGSIDIPLTHRGISESFWVITGTKKDGSLSQDLKCAMKSSATVVIYMGMKKMREISEIYESEGRGSVPAAIIQNATLPNQKHATCRVADLQKTALQHGLSNPAIIVIGDVVSAKAMFYEQYSSLVG